MLQENHIINHFIENPAWKPIYEKHIKPYLNNTKEWSELVWSLLERNGYKYEIEYYNLKHFKNVVKCIDLYGPDSENEDGFIIGYGDHSDKDAAIQYMCINIICDHLIDVTKLK